MGIAKRLTRIIASGFALAAPPEAPSWNKPRPLGPDRPTPGVTPSPALPDQPETASVGPPPVARPPRELTVLALGIALAVAAVAAAVVVWMLVAADASPTPEDKGAAVVTPPAAQPAPCPQEPAVAAASQKDGNFPLLGNVEGLIAADITSFIAIGNQASAAGLPRDAEAALLMACRVADKLKGAGSVESADARYQLGAHYAGLALAPGAGAAYPRTELRGRAERLYADSAQAYIASYGPDHEKSQLAAKGLAAVRQATAPPPAAMAAATPRPAPPAPAPVTPAPAATATARPKPTPQVPATEPPAPTPAQAQAQAPPPRVPPVAAAAPAARPLPPATTPGPSRPQPAVVKECLPTVAALGLCEPGT